MQDNIKTLINTMTQSPTDIGDNPMSQSQAIMGDNAMTEPNTAFYNNTTNSNLL